MYFLSKNMCFLRIKSVFDKKSKKSGQTDGFTAFLCREQPRLKPRDSARHRRRSITDGRDAFSPIRAISPPPKNTKTKKNKNIPIFSILIKSFLIHFILPVICQLSSDFTKQRITQ